MDSSIDIVRRIIPATETMFMVPSAVTFLLDTLSVSASVAFSTRKLRAAYAGSALQVKRSSDGTTQNIGFDGSGNLDTTSLSAFVGANTGTVTIWYDQSGHGFNATTTIAGTTSPTIVISGILNTLNGHPSVVSKNSPPTELDFTITPTLAQPNTTAIIARTTAQVSGASLTDGVAANPRQIFGQNSPFTVWQMYALGADFLTGGTPDLNAHGFILNFNDASSSFYVDNILAASSPPAVGTVGIANQYIGSGNSGAINNPFNGDLPEYIIFPSILGAPDRNTIETSWQNYWGTP